MLSGRLPQLVSDVAAGLGIPCTLRVTGAPRPLGPEAALTAYRTVQEALTNVAKHAGQGAKASVLLAWETDSLDISVADRGGDRPVTVGAPNGFGLTGMAERAALHGGHFEAASSDAGFTVRVRLPLSRALSGERS